MNKKDLKAVGAIAAVGTAIVALHGVTSKRWQTAHTILTVIGAVVALST